MISGFYVFINTIHKNDNETTFTIRGLTETQIKLIMFIFFVFSLFISPVYGPETVILWNNIRPLNFIKAIFSIIACAFLPGGNVYSILFPNENLSKKFKVEPFLLKITIYPVLSFCILGVTVLFLDILGFLGKTITSFLVAMILGLFFLDIITQRFRNRKISLRGECLEISKFTGIILIFAMGVLFIALGIHFNTLYLIVGDSWVGLVPTTYIGQADFNLYDKYRYFGHYPMFWGYIIYALSALSGLPFVNSNAFLAPFCYLYVTSTYLLMKAILYELKTEYAVLSTFFMSIFMSNLYTDYRIELGRLGLVALCEFYFIYKTFGFYLLFISLAIFIVLIRSNQENNLKSTQILIKDEHKYLIISAFFLVISFMTYMIPLIIGLTFTFLFCFFSENKLKSSNFRFYTILTFYTAVFFIIFDKIMFNYLAWIIEAQFEIFFEMTTEKFTENFSIDFLIYSILIGISVLSLIFQQIFRLLFEMRKIKLFNLERDSIKRRLELILKILLIPFSIFLFIEVGAVIYEKISGIDDLSGNFFIFLFLDYIYLYIGFLGILGIFVSFYLYRKKPSLFFYLSATILFSIMLGLTLIFTTFIANYNELPKDLSSEDYVLMRVWFERIWFYSIPGLSIFASYGLIKLVKSFNNKFLIKKKKFYRILFKYTSFSFLVFILFSGLTTAGMWFGSNKGRIRNNEILVIGWASEHLPEDSKIIIERTYNIERGLMTMTHFKIYYLEEEFDEDVNMTQNISKINRMKNKEIEYLLVSKDYLSNSDNLSIFVDDYLIPDFYYDKVYENEDYLIYYAPYFD
jgi:hypothetical protein